MKKTAAVAVIGGGVIGASVAYHLTRHGVRDIVILDRSPGAGEGSTGRATGGFRAQFDTAVNVRLSLLAREELRRFREDTGVDAEFDPIGYLWIATSERQLEELRANQRVQHDAGLREAAEVTAAEAIELNPVLSPAQIMGGAFCPTDGSIRPLQLLRGYLRGASEAGARVEWNAGVEGFEQDSRGRVTVARTSRGDVAVDTVLNCAGPWAAAVGKMAGTDVPVTPLRRQVAVSVASNVLPRRMPMTIFPGDGFHVRVRDGRALLLLPSPGVPGAPFDMRVDESWIADTVSVARERVPAIAAVPVDRAGCYAGLYEMSSDGHAILGRAPGCENMFLVNGSSGHGVMHAPALGRLAAELICEQPTSIDVAPLRPTRFAEGEPIRSSSLL